MATIGRIISFSFHSFNKTQAYILKNWFCEVNNVQCVENYCQVPFEIII